jgi:ubiquitin C-terminal hydrolase
MNTLDAFSQEALTSWHATRIQEDQKSRYPWKVRSQLKMVTDENGINHLEVYKPKHLEALKESLFGRPAERSIDSVVSFLSSHPLPTGNEKIKDSIEFLKQKVSRYEKKNKLSPNSISSKLEAIITHETVIKSPQAFNALCVGMVNLPKTNKCYFNSTMKLLWSLPHFRTVLQNAASSNPMANALKNLFVKIDSTTQKELLNPDDPAIKSIMDILAQTHSEILSTQAQDPLELLQWISDAMGTNPFSVEYTETKSQGSPEASPAPCFFIPFPLETPIVSLQKIFDEELAYEYENKLIYISNQPDPLLLTIQRPQIPITVKDVQDWLNSPVAQSFSSEWIERIQSLVATNDESSLNNELGSKLDQISVLPPPLLFPKGSSDPFSQYELRSINIREGDFTNLGHYYSYIPDLNSAKISIEGQDFPSVWYKHDDAEVTQMNFKDIKDDIAKNCYYIAYEKKAL